MMIFEEKFCEWYDKSDSFYHFSKIDKIVKSQICPFG